MRKNGSALKRILRNWSRIDLWTNANDYTEKWGSEVKKGLIVKIEWKSYVGKWRKYDGGLRTDEWMKETVKCRMTTATEVVMFWTAKQGKRLQSYLVLPTNREQNTRRWVRAKVLLKRDSFLTLHVSRREMLFLKRQTVLERQPRTRSKMSLDCFRSVKHAFRTMQHAQGRRRCRSESMHGHRRKLDLNWIAMIREQKARLFLKVLGNRARRGLECKVIENSLDKDELRTICLFASNYSSLRGHCW
jgi:hypothetical protein